MRSLRRQLTIGLLVAFTLLLGGGGALVYWSVRASVYDQFDAALKAKALVVMTDTQISAGRVKVYFSDRFLREFDRTVATEFFQVFDAQGQTVARSDSLGEKRLPGKLRGPPDAPVYWNLTLPNGEAGRAIGIAFEPRVRRAETSQSVTVVVAVSRRRVIDTMRELRNILVGSGAALLLLTSVVVPLVLRRGLKPLDDVGERIAHIDAGTLEQRFAVDRMPPELQPIGRKLNDLFARLEASFERERRFSADLAHELRTPLAELRSLAELALKWPDERTVDNDRAVLEISLQMEALVARLLALSRAEHATHSLQPTRVDVGMMVDGLLQPLAGRIAEARMMVIRDFGADADITTDPVLFESIIANLLENAVTYGEPGTEVRVSWVWQEKRFQLRVVNSAPELTAEDLTRLFDRFWRKDRARTDGNHAGLGLALSRSFAETLGLDLKATLGNDGVLEMTLSGAV